MKTLKLSFMAFLLAGAMGCVKNHNQPLSNSSDPADQAALLVAGSVSVNSNGAFNAADGLAVEAQAKIRIDSLCGTVWADSASSTHTFGSQTYSYKSKYIYTINCDDSHLSSVTSSLTYSGSFSGPNLSSSNSGSSNFTVAGLGVSAPDYTINGEYKRSGSFQSKTDTSYNGTNSVDIVVTNLVLLKPNRVVKSGTATVTVSASTVRKGDFSYTGIIVFNNDNTATLTINGNIYIINNTTGLVNRRR